jgi:hypothetical protein
MELINCSQNISKKDTVQYFKNIVFYQNKNKQGVFFPTNPKKHIEFDTIVKNFHAITSSAETSEITFLVGNKVEKTNRYQYSLYSNIKGLLLPIQFDALQIFKMQPTNYGITIYQSKIGNHYGLIEYNGKEILKPEYDIFQKPNYDAKTHHITKNYILKKNNKFGLIYQNSITNKTEIIDAIFDYEIDDVFVNYPNTKNNGVSSQIIKLVSLKNSENEIIGYANANGMLYFKN